MLPHSIEKVKAWISENRADLFTSCIIFLIGIASFGLGRLSVLLPQKDPIRFEDTASLPDQRDSTTSSLSLSDSISPEANPRGITITGPNNALFVASKSGSAYYATWCSGASKIREENRVWFQTKQDAQAKGYRPAKNCSGL